METIDKILKFSKGTKGPQMEVTYDDARTFSKE